MCVLVLYFTPTGFFPGTPIFSPLKKDQHFDKIALNFLGHNFTDVNFKDGLVLHKFPTSYKANGEQLPFYSIKWAIMGTPVPSPIWDRDVCWLEYADIIQDNEGKEIGFGVVCKYCVLIIGISLLLTMNSSNLLKHLTRQTAIRCFLRKFQV